MTSLGFLLVLRVGVDPQIFARRKRRGNFRSVEWYDERFRGGCWQRDWMDRREKSSLSVTKHELGQTQSWTLVSVK